MKTMKTKLHFFFTLCLILLFTSCISDQSSQMISATSMEGFDFKTTQIVHVSVSTLNNANQPINGVLVRLFSQNPMNADGTIKSDYLSYLLYTGTTSNGVLECQISPATTVDSLTVLVDLIGLPQLQTVKLSSSDVKFVIGGTSASSVRAQLARQKSVSSDVLPTPTLVSGFYTLGTWDSTGVPNYLCLPNDVVANSLMADLTSTLPETKSLLISHPTYLDETKNASVQLFEDAEVWLTFLHEGAGYTSTLGYYTYPSATPPTKISDIKDKTVIFPNVSFYNSGGGLHSGNKVQLLYLDPKTNTYTKIFPAGTTVAWVLHAQGWSGSSIKAINPAYTFYSNSYLNPEPNASLRKHNLVLNDISNKYLIVTFEDMRRDQGSDDDFNDVVFYATATPETAIHRDLYETVAPPVDTDGDGVPDTSDDYPKDPLRAHNNYYPSKGVNASLAFEDLWPYKGDYDFNDMVVDYNYNQITNAQNQVVAVDAQLKLRALGASYHNGFGISFNTTPANVVSVTGQMFSKGYLNIASNGTENNQSKAVIIAFDDAYGVMPSSTMFVNTTIGNSYVTPKTFALHIEFKTPISASDFGTAPYNPFIIVNQTRGREVHLANAAPTSLADLKLFGTGNDKSDPSTGKYYIADSNLPWALNLPISFDYPVEKKAITSSFLFFTDWATSKGTKNTDWYVNKAGYRNASEIYK